MEASEYQLVVVGAGPGGYVAAIRAAQLGFRVAIVEKAEFGGVCLNWGCIPTKTLLRSAEVLRTVQQGAAYGVLLDSPPRFDLETAVKRSRTVAAQLNQGVRGLLKKNNVTSLYGHARLLGSGKLEVECGAERTLINSEHIILATGARPRMLPGLDLDDERVWTASEAMTPKSIPKTLAVIGAGAIGVEFASFFATLGSEVTLLESADRILSHEDDEISAKVKDLLCSQGLDVRSGINLQQAVPSSSGIEIHFDQTGKTCRVNAERVIVAVGIVGNVEELGLENTRAQVEKGHLLVDQWSRTDEPGLYAIGDVAGPPWLAHKASHEGVACVERIAGLPDARALDPGAVPSCIYSHPQVASVGLTEAQARAQGFTVTVGRFPFAGNGKALSLGDTDGMIKTVFDESSGELLGAHMVGPDVTELIATYATARSLETTESELMHTIFPHPTLSEGLHESVLAAFGRTLHI
jgi:dihydrolipoamide dehydrogenase